MKVKYGILNKVCDTACMTQDMKCSDKLTHALQPYMHAIKYF